MKGRCDYGVTVNPWVSKEQVVRCVNVNDIIHHLRLQVSNLVYELDLSYRAHTIGVEAIDGSLGGA